MTTYTSSWIRAYTNIALIKYWGKADEALKLPKNNSISLTLDSFYTDTHVQFDSRFTADTLTIDGQDQNGAALKKAKIILDLVREIAQVDYNAKITSLNYVPTAAGLASSASGLAALAGAASNALELNLSDTDLSRLARRGSGSASRSIFGGFVEWEKGHSDVTSVAKPLDDANWDIGMLFIILDSRQKAVSSSEGMSRTVATSVFYPAWLETIELDLADMRQAIKDQSIQQVGEIAERNALKMHGTNLGANPPFTYWSAESLRAMEHVRQLRQEGHNVYFTMDAGPNVKLISTCQELKEIKEHLSKYYDPAQLILAQPGPGLTVLPDHVHADITPN